MITILFYMTAKTERLAEVETLAKEMMTRTRASWEEP